MTAPTFVGNSTINGAVDGAAATYTYTATGGNLLICFATVSGISATGTNSGTVTFSTGGTNGWTLGGTLNAGSNNGSVCWAYKIAAGGGAADDPHIGWGASTYSWHLQIFEFSGQSTSWLGANNNAQGSSSPLTAASLSVQPSSLVLAMIFNLSGTAVSLPGSYTLIDIFSSPYGSDCICYQTPAGSTSTAISEFSASGYWASFALEITSLVIPTGTVTMHLSGISMAAGGSSHLVYGTVAMALSGISQVVSGAQLPSPGGIGFTSYWYEAT